MDCEGHPNRQADFRTLLPPHALSSDGRGRGAPHSGNPPPAGLAPISGKEEVRSCCRCDVRSRRFPTEYSRRCPRWWQISPVLVRQRGFGIRYADAAGQWRCPREDVVCSHPLRVVLLRGARVTPWAGTPAPVWMSIDSPTSCPVRPLRDGRRSADSLVPCRSPWSLFNRRDQRELLRWSAASGGGNPYEQR